MLAEEKRVAWLDPEVQLLYQYIWKPACYAAPEWLYPLGFHPSGGWRYGEQPELDQWLDRALRTRRGTRVIPAHLTDQQRHMVQRAPRLQAFALALGLMKIGRSDYFMLPDYRQRLLEYLTEDEIWRLYGWLGPRTGSLFAPAEMPEMAIQIGKLILHREASDNPVLFALLIFLPPPERTLWPCVTRAEVAFLEHLIYEPRSTPTD